MTRRFGAFSLVLTCALVLPSTADKPDLSRLPTGQRIHPAGEQISLTGTMPMNIVLRPGTSQAAVICSGKLQGLSLVDLAKKKEGDFLAYQTLTKTARGNNYTPTGSAYYGLARSTDGQTLYAGRGGEDTIGQYQIVSDMSAMGGSKVIETGTLPDTSSDPAKKNFPAGVALSPDGTRLYAANNQADTLTAFDLASKKPLGSVPVGGYPLSVTVSHDGAKVYVSSERDSVVSVVDAQAMTKTKDIPTGAHPDALLLNKDGSKLYVANGDSDTVSVVDTASDSVTATIPVRPTQARGLPGATPTGLALAPDEKTLYVTLADLNAVAVVALPSGDLRGYLPTGWYPTVATVSGDGKTLYVVNGKGSQAQHANPNGPGPGGKGDGARYIHAILTGSISVIPIADDKTLAKQTAQVLADNNVSKPLDSDAGVTEKRLAALPIKHIVYIIKENRTYDQVLGDVKGGNGDPNLVLFGRDVTPNLHALAERFVLLDNFYDCAEVSADGWNWSTAGFANEYVQRTVPENYSEERRSPRTGRDYDYEGENRGVPVSLQGIPDVATSPGGYLWDNVAQKGLTYRNYGFFLSFQGKQPDKPALAGHTCPDFAPFDMSYADSDAWKTLGLPGPGTVTYGTGDTPSRYSAWKREFDGYVRDGNLPAFEFLRVPRDHTSGTSPGQDSPRAMAADNDYAVGEIVQAVSQSPYWKDTAIFVVEDDAQNGPDHVDAHRSTAYVISPYVKKGIDHHFYNTDSLIRTMEELAGLPPMTRLDAIAPTIRAFTDKPDLTPYTAQMADKAILGEKNTRTAYGAARSQRMNFALADAAPDDELNDILWHSIKGAAVPYPVRTRR